MKLFFKKVSTLPLTLVGGSQREARETGALPRLSRTVGQLPSQSRLPPCQLSRRESQVSPPPLGEVSCLWHDGEGKVLAAPSHGLCGNAGKLPSQSPNGASSPRGGAKSRLPLWGRCPRRGRRGLREATFLVRHRPGKTLRCFPSFSLADAHKGKVVGLCPTTRKLFEKSLTKNF